MRSENYRKTGEKSIVAFISTASTPKYPAAWVPWAVFFSFGEHAPSEVVEWPDCMVEVKTYLPVFLLESQQVWQLSLLQENIEG